MANRNKLVVPGAQAAIDNMKAEIALSLIHICHLHPMLFEFYIFGIVFYPGVHL